jgi:hypothetical protein
VIYKTTDHVPTNEFEKNNILSKGGLIKNGRICADLGGELAVSRSFGDFPFENYITTVPSVYKIQIKKDSFHSYYIMLGCDGLFEKTIDINLINIINSLLPHTSIEQIVHTVCKKALENGSKDNITCVLMQLGSKFTKEEHIEFYIGSLLHILKDRKCREICNSMIRDIFFECEKSPTQSSMDSLILQKSMSSNFDMDLLQIANVRLDSILHNSAYEEEIKEINEYLSKYLDDSFSFSRGEDD